MVCHLCSHPFLSYVFDTLSSAVRPTVKQCGALFHGIKAILN
ncbi:hypothetical protein HMPREF0663_11506 [Hoylesella oralis ATCC 33269]|uniref:Uncharacterized protein n=1 Tax=Hoylesella oralis ATCC 33269 TaxID=873533 RepID=E7RQQ5_9BACT|nr:hypothetical protein HMPREF0663_11506 [Hoylesella oralis ATCC 33269]